MTVSQSTLEDFRSMVISINHTLRELKAKKAPYVYFAQNQDSLFFDAELTQICNYREELLNENSGYLYLDTTTLLELGDSRNGADIDIMNSIKDKYISSIIQQIKPLVKEIKTYSSTERDRIFSFLDSTGELSGDILGCLVFGYREHQAKPSKQECMIMVNNLIAEDKLTFLYFAQGFLQHCDFSDVDEESYAQAKKKVNEAIKEKETLPQQSSNESFNLGSFIAGLGVGFVAGIIVTTLST